MWVFFHFLFMDHLMVLLSTRYENLHILCIIKNLVYKYFSLIHK
uniref:Uncharacterized protein n=1 Tax=Anguilla anguilla TaxID=7936 RepID=A0A0E9RUC9_ANGAN